MLVRRAIQEVCFANNAVDCDVSVGRWEKVSILLRTQPTARALEKKLVTKDLEQGQSIKEHRAHAGSIYESLETKLKDKTAWLDEKFSDMCSLLDKKFTEESAKQINSIDSEHKYFDELCTGLDKGPDEHTTELNNKFTASCANLESGVTALGTKFTAAVRDVVDTTLSNKCADLYAKVDSLGLELRNKLHGAVSELDGKADSLVNKLDKKIMSSGGEAGVRPGGVRRLHPAQG